MATIKTFGKEYSYVLKRERDKPESEQTVWYYKLPPLDAQFDEGEEIIFQGDLASEENNDVTTKFKPANEVKKQAKIIKVCLVKVENLFNDDGQPVEWPKDNRTHKRDELIAALPPTWRAELAGVFRHAAIISEDEVKN